MKITGIIAEYNPFHNGHAYQIAKIKEETDSDYVIVAMSGDFVQRGEPAITDKYERAKNGTLLRCGSCAGTPCCFCLRFCRIFCQSRCRALYTDGLYRLPVFWR